MKTSTKFLSILLAVMMLLTLCACGENDDSGTANYQVKVLDGEGVALTSGVIVKFIKDGQQVAMQPINSEGIAAKELAKSDYTVELTFTDSEMNGYYDTSLAVLSADKTYLELSLINSLGDTSFDLTIGEKNYTAFLVNAGSTYVPVKASVRNYFMFSPEEAGNYKISVNNNDIKVGYYGSPFFVQEASAVDVVDNSFMLSIAASSLGGSYVLGLDGAAEDTNVIFNVIRIGDPTTTISDIPWTPYATTHTPAPYTLQLNGKSLKYVDVKGETADYQLVYNVDDGFYHLGAADGPVMLVHLGKKAPYFSLQTIIEGDGLGGGAPIRAYFFDGKGTAVENLIKKEDYTEILRSYFENMDQAAGVYPLTKDLEYIIKNGCKQWWDKNDTNYNADFSISDCNPELGWMFALCYVA